MRLYNSESCTPVATVAPKKCPSPRSFVPAQGIKRSPSIRSPPVPRKSKQTTYRLGCQSPTPRRLYYKNHPWLSHNDTVSTETSESFDYITSRCSSESFHFDIDVVKKTTSESTVQELCGESISKTSSSTLTTDFSVDRQQPSVPLLLENKRVSSASDNHSFSDSEDWRSGILSFSDLPPPCRVKYRQVSKDRRWPRLGQPRPSPCEPVSLFPTSRATRSGDFDDDKIEAASWVDKAAHWEEFSDRFGMNSKVNDRSFGSPTRELVTARVGASPRSEPASNMRACDPSSFPQFRQWKADRQRDPLDHPWDEHGIHQSQATNQHRVPELLGHILEERYQLARERAKKRQASTEKTVDIPKRPSRASFWKPRRTTVDEIGFPLLAQGSDAVILLVDSQDEEANRPTALFVRRTGGQWSEMQSL